MMVGKFCGYLGIFNANNYTMQNPRETGAKFVFHHIYQISSWGFFQGKNKYNE